MIDPNLIPFVWNTFVSGIVGNAAYDGIKAILSQGFDRLAVYAKKGEKKEFDIALISILETNENIVKQLSQLREGSLINIQKQNHNGTGDNIGRDKIININQISLPYQTEKYILTDRQKDALRNLVKIGRRWRGEFDIIWHVGANFEISDILNYDGNPPEILRSDIRALNREHLLDCGFISDYKAHIALTPISYSAVDANFLEST